MFVFKISLFLVSYLMWWWWRCDWQLWLTGSLSEVVTEAPTDFILTLIFAAFLPAHYCTCLVPKSLLRRLKFQDVSAISGYRWLHFWPMEESEGDVVHLWHSMVQTQTTIFYRPIYKPLTSQLCIRISVFFLHSNFTARATV